jgi:uncharacterized membrane protein (TIGR02234 family)
MSTVRSRVEYVLALLLDVIGAGGVLLVSTRTWQTIRTVRARPFATDLLHVSGRTVDAAPTALALVGLAGLVAVLATRGVARRVVGALVAVAGVATVWRSAAAVPAVGEGRARVLLHDKHEIVSGTGVVDQTVTTHPVWGVLSIAGGVLMLLAGALIAWRGSRWASMSARYETPAPAPDPDDDRARARADATLWTALERGEDPTADDPHAPQ